MDSSIVLPNWQPFLVEGTSGVYYIPEFVSEEEEAYLLRQIADAPKPKWKTLSNRRLQVWGGEIAASGTLLPQPLPPFLNKFPDIISRLRATGAFSSSQHGEPNHVIVNEYLPGQGIMPHEDGPSYHPVVATISLGSHTVFNYYRYSPDCEPDLVSSPTEPREGEPIAGRTDALGSGTSKGRAVEQKPLLSLLLEPRSLVITTSSLYTQHLHGIEPNQEDKLLPHKQPNHALAEHPEDDTTGGAGFRVTNWNRLRDDALRSVAEKGGLVRRGIRVSLTCRDVERVFAFAGHSIQR